MKLLRRERWALPKETNSLGSHRAKGAEGPTLTWSPKLEVDGMPIAYDATLRHYHEGHVGLVAEALEQPLLLPKDIEAYRNFNHPKLFLSLKRDLPMVSDCIRCSSFIHLHFLTFCSKGEIPLVFVYVFFYFYF